MTNKRKQLSVDDYFHGIQREDRTILARALTLIESNNPAHMAESRQLLTRLMPLTGSSIRVGITGTPGAGKSSLIEALGLYLIDQGYKIAVLAVDPTSALTGGSILGDKTRMEKLGRQAGCFIRPSPSGRALGGVATKTRESILVCEAAGYNVVLVETIGVGQSEIAVRSMVDFFLLIQIAGAGDELQGIKKGVIEIADAIFINKADGDNKVRAEIAMKELATALHYLKAPTQDWQPKVDICSALTGEGIEELWQTILSFKEVTSKNGTFDKRRKDQARDWMHALVTERLQSLFFSNPAVHELVPSMEAAVMAGKMPASQAADRLISIFEQSTAHAVQTGRT